MCAGARPSPGMGAKLSGLPSVFWVLPYEPEAYEPQLLAAVERYILPDRDFRVRKRRPLLAFRTVFTAATAVVDRSLRVR